jgi:hypothetical protein
MNKHRYSLEKGSKKHHCPECNKRTFVLYIDTVTGDYLPEQFGRCDRESKCSYHLNPYLNGYAKAIQEQERGKRSEFQYNRKPQLIKLKPQPTAKPLFFDFETFKQTLQPDRYEKNTFIQNLFYRVQFPFEVDEVTKLIQLYRLGTIASGYRAGANTFPFIDIKGNVRAIQVKQFNEQNHTTGTDFLHSIIEKHHTRNKKPLPKWLEAYTKQDKRITCLFGEQLLSKYQSNPIALVEAPKTAVYGALYFGLPETPQSLIWLAVYNKSSFSFDKLKVLQGRIVYVFPDLSKDGSTFKEWEAKAKEYESRLPGTRFIFSDYLEQYSTPKQKEQGADIADILITKDWRLFRKLNAKVQPPQPETKHCEAPIIKTVSHLKPLPNIEFTYTIKKEQPQNWSNYIAEIENYFASIELPTQPIKLNKCSTITDCTKFIKSHITTIKANNGKQAFLPYLNRLQELKQALTINPN